VVRGRIVDQATQAPVAGVRLVLDTPGKSPRAESDARGAFVIKGVPTGQRLRVDVPPTVPGYLANIFFVRVPDGQRELDIGVVKLSRRGP